MCMSELRTCIGESTGSASSATTNKRPAPLRRRRRRWQSHSIARDSKTDFIMLTMGKKVQ